MTFAKRCGDWVGNILRPWLFTCIHTANSRQACMYGWPNVTKLEYHRRPIGLAYIHVATIQGALCNNNNNNNNNKHDNILLLPYQSHCDSSLVSRDEYRQPTVGLYRSDCYAALRRILSVQCLHVQRIYHVRIVIGVSILEVHDV